MKLPDELWMIPFLKILSILFILLISLIAYGRSTPKTFAAGKIVTVNSTGDGSDASPGDGICAASGGDCTFRAALEELNGLGVESDPHQIHFAIPGDGPHTIYPQTSLPPVEVPMIIDGTTQPGVVCPTTGQAANLKIILDGSQMGPYDSGLALRGRRGASSGSTIRGLVIGRFPLSGLTIHTDNNKIECNHVGVAVDGISPMGNTTSGISIPSGINNTIGGADSEAQRNVISDNGSYGINGWSDEGSLISNNYIGTTAGGLSPLGNKVGVYFQGSTHNVLGGTASLSKNVISGNEEYGVYFLGANANHVMGNDIGLAGDGLSPLPNGWDGIAIRDTADNNVIGGVAPGEGNRIAYNGDNGIIVKEQNEFIVPENNSLRGNLIFDNGDLGIDLGLDGVDSNDSLDADGGPNSHQNYPILTSATSNGEIAGTLESNAEKSFYIDYYVSENCDDSGYGQGQNYLGSSQVTTDSSGFASIDLALNISLTAGHQVTAAATNEDGSTSEFSACVAVGGDGPGKEVNWISDCEGAAPPPPLPGGDQSVFLPIVAAESRPSAAAISNIGSFQDLTLDDGTVVTGVDGVTLGSVSGTLPHAINVSINQVSAPVQPPLTHVQVHGAYYHMAADQNVYMCDQEKGFVLGLPLPNGLPTDHLAIAALPPQSDNWVILSGLYDQDSALMLVPMGWLTEEGSTVVLVESVGFSSQRDANSTAEEFEARSSDLTVDEMDFFVVCKGSDGPNCINNKKILTDYLKQIYNEFGDLGFDHGPWLRYKSKSLKSDPNEVEINLDKSSYEVLGGSCDNLGLPLGDYDPYSKTAQFCFSPPAALSDKEIHGIRHHYFSALQFGYDDIVANYIFDPLHGLENEWILLSTAATAEMSTASQLQSSWDYKYRWVDVPLRSPELLHPYYAQDFWVYNGRRDSEGLGMLREVLEAPNAGTMEGLFNFFNGQEMFQDAYLHWARNQIMVEDSILLHDRDLGNPCHYTLRDEKSYRHDIYQTVYTNAPGTLEPLTTHTIVLGIADHLRPAVIEVHDPKDKDNPDVRYKIYVNGEENCNEINDDSRTIYEPEWGEILARGVDVYIVVTNVNHEEDNNYEVVVETAPYTP